MDVEIQIVSLVTLVALVLGFAYQWWQEQRHARRLLREVEAVHEAVDKNTTISTKAFHEASTVNSKLERLVETKTEATTPDDGAA